MADPVFDENGIIEMLSLPVTRECTDGIRVGAAQTILDMYDRKVTRDEFCKALDPVLNLYSYLGKLNLLHSMHRVSDDGKLNEAAFSDAEKQLSEMVRANCAVAIEIMKRLQQCPTSEDKVH